MKEDLELHVAALESALEVGARGLFPDSKATIDEHAAEIARLERKLARIIDICDHSLSLDDHTAGMALRIVRDLAADRGG